MNARQQQAEQWFRTLQNEIIAGLETLEAEHSNTSNTAEAAHFTRTPWQRTVQHPPTDKTASGGGGVMAILRGRVFEKAGVNFSAVHGHFSEHFRNEIPGAEANGAFWASGVSLVVHPHSPWVPIIHMNTRMITSGKSWFGGGIDLTPALLNPQETRQFHGELAKVCKTFNPDYYSQFKARCDEYFFLSHRNEPRGVGGIFYDNLNSGDWGQDFAFTQAVGRVFLELYRPLVCDNAERPWGEAEAEAQWLKRSRYVEFNLLFDRGTRFGIMTGGNPDAILMSLPPRTGWR